MPDEPMPEERLVRIEEWMQAHDKYWAARHSGSGIDSLVRYTHDLIAEVRRLQSHECDLQGRRPDA